ncbi:MAG: hypothetical protein IT239_07255 [Bacteroidia bacterium]|nr:hypothetical protein [Bacteroidia bacterium]
MRKVVFLIIIVFVSHLLFAQEIAIGQWRVHLPYSNCISVAAVKNKIYAATPTGMFSYNKEDNSIIRLSRINGLSDLSINILTTDDARNQLLIGYGNGNIDIIENDGNIVNLSDIKRKSFAANKTINNISINNNIAYLATGFGVVVLDLAKKEIKDTYLIGNNGSYINVHEAAVFNGFIYAATDKGLYKASLNAPNLANFSYWSRETFLPLSSFNSLAVIGNCLFANNSPYKPNGDITTDKDTTFKLENNVWTNFNATAFYTARSLQNLDGKLARITNYNIGIYDINGTFLYSYYDYNLAPAAPTQLVKDNEGILWISDLNNGLVKVLPQGFSAIIPNGPSNTSSTCYSATNDGELYVAKGGISGAWGNLFLTPEIYVFKDGEWKVLNQFTDAGLNNMPDVLRVTVNPNNNAEVYAASYFNGLIKLVDKKVDKIYNETNSTLLRNYRCGISGMTFDDNGNLWLANTISNKPLQVLKADGTWKSFSLSGITNAVFTGNIIIDDFGKKWMQLPLGVGLFVYDDNGTIDDITDDKQQMLNETIGKGGLHTTDISSIAKDLDGNIWIGTDKGITVFNNPGGVFTGGNYDAQQIKIEQNGVVANLLESERVTAIAVDAANRKWLGTESSGVFLVSEDGTKELKHFTTENSPILSNSILSIGINAKTGEVFFGTENGIISYKSDATQPTENFNDVYAYPNPVKPDYNGVIAIKNLTEKSTVKITDTQGNLVYETTSLGGQAIWNGKNFSGQKVETGVYLVFSSGIKGEKTNVTKIVFIK